MRRGDAVLLLSGEGHLQRSRQVGQSEHCGLNRHALLDAPGCDPTHAMASVSFRLFAAPRIPRLAALDPPGLIQASSTMAMRARPQDRVASGWTWGRRAASFSCVVKDPSSDVRVIRPQGAEDGRGGERFNYYRLSHHYYECWISDRLQPRRSTTQGHQVVVAFRRPDRASLQTKMVPGPTCSAGNCQFW